MIRRRVFWQRVIWIAAAFVLCWTAAVFLLAGQYVDRLLAPGCGVAPVQPTGGFEEVRIPAGPRGELPGWWMPSRNGEVLILLGGHRQGRSAWMGLAQALSREGYGVLTFDYAYCAGQPATLGAAESTDLRAALDWVGAHAAGERVVVFGFSAGGVTAIRTAVSSPEISAVIAVGNYANLWDEIVRDSGVPLSLTWQLRRAVGVLISFRLREWAGAVSPIDDLPRLSPRPVFLIHGEKEIASTRGAAQFQAAGQPKRLWVVPGADHGEYISVAGEEFERQVLIFLEGIR